MIIDPVEVFPTQMVGLDAKCVKASSISMAETKISLKDLIGGIEEILGKGEPTELRKQNEVKDLLERFDAGLNELDEFSFFDPNKRYTRNLVSTDGKTYTLMLLCWSPDKESPIHDHPNAGCWMRVIKGTLFEKQYAREGSRLVPTTSREAPEGTVLYIDDNINLHKVGCLTEGGAISLHLYSPPFQKCSIWMNEDMDANKPIQPVMTFYSEYGRVIDYCSSPSARCCSSISPIAEAAAYTKANAAPCTSKMNQIIEEFELGTSYSDPATATRISCTSNDSVH